MLDDKFYLVNNQHVVVGVNKPIVGKLLRIMKPIKEEYIDTIFDFYDREYPEMYEYVRIKYVEELYMEERIFEH